MSKMNGNINKNEIIIDEQQRRNNNDLIKENKNINDSSRNNTTQEKESIFIKPTYKIKWEEIIQNSYHFKQDIERVWLIVRNFDLLILINNKDHYPCVSIKGQDTFKVGNEFKGNLFSIFPFIARVEKTIILPEIKTIKWLFYIDNKSYIKIIFELFKVTEDNTCVIIWKLKLENSQYIKNNYEKKKLNKMNNNELFKTIEKLLESQPINLFQYESVIINSKMEDVWNMVTDSNKLTVIAPNNNCLPNFNIGNMKVGEKLRTSGFYKDEYYEIDITLEYKEDRKGWNKWLFVILISNSTQKKIPKNTIVIQLTKINEEECQLTFVSKYHDSIDTNEFKNLSKRKKYLLLSLKDYFDNFYSPSNSD